MKDNNVISENIFESFAAADYSLNMIDFKKIYFKINQLMPDRNISFREFSLDIAIACEVVAAAICHKINWDFLRTSILNMTKNDIFWLTPKKLANISIEKIEELLGKYDKPERIRAKERCQLLKSLGATLSAMNYDYRDIFFDGDSIRNEEEIFSIINCIPAFGTDPEGKKTQLLLQNLSEYTEFRFLDNYCKPAIDYHIIREFLRRGLVVPTNQKAYEFILNPQITRQEKTIAGLRKVCSEIFYTLEWITSCNITTLNTIEWRIGRSVCLKENPDCNLVGNKSQWLKPYFTKCPFYESCHAIQVDNKFLEVVEPNYQGSSY